MCGQAYNKEVLLHWCSVAIQVNIVPMRTSTIIHAKALLLSSTSLYHQSLYIQLRSSELVVVRYIVLSYIGLLDQARTMVKLQEIGAMVFHSATRLGRAIEE